MQNRVSVNPRTDHTTDGQQRPIIAGFDKLGFLPVHSSKYLPLCGTLSDDVKRLRCRYLVADESVAMFSRAKRGRFIMGCIVSWWPFPRRINMRTGGCVGVCQSSNVCPMVSVC